MRLPVHDTSPVLPFQLEGRLAGPWVRELDAYGQVALARADVVVPALPGEEGTRVAAEAAVLGGRHRLVRVPVDGLADALRECPVGLSTMGRSLDEDLPYFLSCAAAGRHAAQLLAATS